MTNRTVVRIGSVRARTRGLTPGHATAVAEALGQAIAAAVAARGPAGAGGVKARIDRLDLGRIRLHGRPGLGTAAEIAARVADAVTAATAPKD